MAEKLNKKPSEVYKEWSSEYNSWLQGKVEKKSPFGGETIQQAPPKSTLDKIKEKIAETFSGSRLSEILQGYGRTYNPKTGLYEQTQNDPETGKEISVLTGEEIVPELGTLQQVTRIALIILAGLVGIMALFQIMNINPISALPARRLTK